MKTQNYTNHRKLDPIYHGIIVMCCVLGSVILIISLIKLLLVNAALLENFPWFMKTIYIGVFLIAIGLIFMTFRLRQYSLQNQDRIIKLEEGFRYYVLTGKQIDPNLTIGQLTALRFAPDEEFLDLCHQVIVKNMTPDAIKKSIKNRRADYHRI